MRRLGCLFFIGVALLFGPAATAATPAEIEVVDVSGIIDANVERTISRVVAEAERQNASLLVLEMNSNGTVGAGRAERIAARIRTTTMPVAAWIGPAGARARNGAAVIWQAADYRAMAPASLVGPIDTLDLREDYDREELQNALQRLNAGFLGTRSAEEAKQSQWAHYVVGSVGDLLSVLDGAEYSGPKGKARLDLDPRRDAIRLHKLDLLGRALHAAAQPSITYLLVLLGLVGMLFEAFHPSTGPAGVAGALAMGLGVYGVVTLGASWLGFALVVAGVVGFAVDLRYQSLGVFTLAGFAALVAGSILLFPGPWLRVPPWLIAGGVAGMTAFLLGAMTRVLRDLRLVASGQLQVRDAHEAVTGVDKGQGGPDGR